MAEGQLETAFDNQRVIGLQCRCQGICCHVSYVIASAENERRLTQKSSCQGGTIHYHRYIPRELCVSTSDSHLDIQSIPGASELILLFSIDCQEVKYSREKRSNILKSTFNRALKRMIA